MSTMPRRAGDVRTGFRTTAAVALTVSLMGALAALPTASASASVPTTATVEIPSGDLGSIFETIPVADLGLSNEQLGQVLSGINGLGGLSSQLESVVSSLLNSNPNATIGQLTGGVLGNGTVGTILKALKLGLEPNQILGALNPGQLSTLLGNLPLSLNGDQLAQLLAGLSGTLNTEQLGSLQSVLAPVTGILSTGELTDLQTDLKDLLSGLSTGNLSSILETLKSTLSGAQLTQLEGLLGNLGSLSLPELKTQLETLLTGLTGNQLSGLLSTLLGKLEPGDVQPVLTDLLGNLPLSPKNAGELAGEFGTSVEELSSDLGTSLTSATPALTSTLGKEGPVLSLLSDLSGLKLDLLSGEKPAGEKGGNGGNGGSGGSGGSGEGTENTSQGGPSGNNNSAGGSSNPPAQTITVVLPASIVASGTTKAAAAKALAKVKIISHKVKGNVATLVLQVPAAGKVKVSGAHVTKVSRTVGKAERVTIKVKLTRAGVASLKRHKKLLRVVLKALFTPKSGPTSSAVTSTKFV
jgi:hypothetical protein